jgi:hypothetical protein
VVTLHLRPLVVFATAAALAGCQGTDVADAPAPPESRSCADDSAATGHPLEVSATLTHGRVDPFPRRIDVARGTPVVLRVTSDAPAEIHVHGYDVAAQATPGATTCLALIADRPGLFDVEAHPATLLFQLAVQ